MLRQGLTVPLRIQHTLRMVTMAKNLSTSFPGSSSLVAPSDILTPVTEEIVG
jgi:hypothetical protein